MGKEIFLKNLYFSESLIKLTQEIKICKIIIYNFLTLNGIFNIYSEKNISNEF